MVALCAQSREVLARLTETMEARLNVLDDKSEETVGNTIAALWHAPPATRCLSHGRRRAAFGIEVANNSIPCKHSSISGSPARRSPT